MRTGFPFNHTLFDHAPHGYVEEQYFVSGTARDHLNGGADAPFTTRVVVRRPLDPARFNGTVWIEWLNVTSGSGLPGPPTPARSVAAAPDR